MPDPTKPSRAGKKMPARYMSLRDGQRELTRKALTEAGIRCFRNYGYNSTTIEQIAEQAGTTVRTFYRHFADKTDLLKPMRAHLRAEVERLLVELDAIDVRSRAEVRRWLDRYVIMCTRIHRLTSAHWEAAALDEAFAESALDDTFSCLELLPNILARTPSRHIARQTTRLALMVLVLDRIALAVTTDNSAKRANAMLEETAGLLWAILNNADDLDAG